MLFKREPTCSTSPTGLRMSTSSSASLRVAPLSSKAVRKRASSLHNSQSPSSLALPNNRTSCSELDDSSSKVCRTSRYPPAVFKEPCCKDSSKRVAGGGRYANSVRQDRTSVFLVHCTMISKYCGNEDRNETTPGNSACSGRG